MESVQNEIIKKASIYSKNQKQVANYILENLQTVPLQSISELANNTHVSPATIVRFTRLLGFEGYMDFRNSLMDDLKNKLSPLERYKETLSQKEKMPNTLEKTAETVIENIRYSVVHNDIKTFKAIVEHIRQAENIFCAGMGISRQMAEIMAYLLKLYMKKAFTLSNDSPSFQEQIILVKPEDLLIIFSFPPYSRPTVEIASQAREMNIPVVSFTDKKTAPVVQFSNYHLISKTDNILFTNSLGAIGVLMNALITELALSEETTVISGLEKVERFLNDKRYFY